MTIMLAGGMVIAAPSMVPEAAAAGALYVSAENAQFGNLFGGPQIVEVIVKDPSRSAVNEDAGEPTVLVDNQRLRLAQGIDGNWYGYFGDTTDIDTLVAVGDSDLLNFTAAGTLTAANGGTHTTFASKIHTSIPADGGVIDNPPTLSNWNSTGITTSDSCVACGQIGVASGEWPFIQAFDFTQGDFDVKLLNPKGSDFLINKHIQP
jgi:hypothetical protein